MLKGVEDLTFLLGFEPINPQKKEKKENMLLRGLIPGLSACKSNALPLCYRDNDIVQHFKQLKDSSNWNWSLIRAKPILGIRFKVFFTFLKNPSWNMKNFFLYVYLHTYTI